MWWVYNESKFYFTCIEIVLFITLLVRRTHVFPSLLCTFFLPHRALSTGGRAGIRGEVAWSFGKMLVPLTQPRAFFEINWAISRAQSTHCMFKGREEPRL